MKLRLLRQKLKKKVAAAQGEAEALKIKGDAEAEYNRKISASLSVLIVQQDMIKKVGWKTSYLWSGSHLI